MRIPIEVNVTTTKPIKFSVPDGYELVSLEPRVPHEDEWYIDMNSEPEGAIRNVNPSSLTVHGILGKRRFILKPIFAPKLGEVVQVRDRDGEWATRVFIKFIQKYNQTRALVFDWVDNFDQVGCENDSKRNTFSSWEQIRPL